MPDLRRCVKMEKALATNVARGVSAVVEQIRILSAHVVGRNDAEVATPFQLFLYSLRFFQSGHETSFFVVEKIEESI